MTTILHSLALVLTLGSVSNVALASDVWNDANNPAIMDQNFVYNFASLPTEASLATKPWSETYWATAKGSINIRWNQAQPDGFHYALNTREQLMSMSRDQLAALSPTEKLDIYNGNYDYPLHKEVAQIANPNATWWKGLCDGWTMSANQFKEPAPMDVTNADGIVIPFGSSDIKGLLAYYAQFRSGVRQVYVGGQCRGLTGIFGGSSCSDINPGAMHVILTNQLGLRNQAFAMDRDPGPQIWNQPIFGFKTTVLGSARSDGASGVLVHTTIFYTDELDQSSFTPVGNTSSFASDKVEMEYTLDLDASGNIVGGSYSHNSDHPDLMWKAAGPIVLQGDFAKVNDLLVP
jgi:hypothetical protein